MDVDMLVRQDFSALAVYLQLIKKGRKVQWKKLTYQFIVMMRQHQEREFFVEYFVFPVFYSVKRRPVFKWKKIYIGESDIDEKWRKLRE